MEGGLPDPITGSACPVAVGDGGVWVEGFDRELNHVLVGRLAFGTLRVDVARVIANGDHAPTVAFDFGAGTMWANDGQDLTRYELP